MYIEEVVIEGFKSYAQRTVLSGFDTHFNAITGLNGTGKSNILDSICFVLGISNLTQVRVGNLQELVYKQGQAGVTKASVTLVFNNKDKKGSPVGYEHFDQITITCQIVIGGKNKYMINGHTAQASHSTVWSTRCSNPSMAVSSSVVESAMRSPRARSRSHAVSQCERTSVTAVG